MTPFVPDVPVEPGLPDCGPLVMSAPERPDRYWLCCQKHGVRIAAFWLGRCPERHNFQLMSERMAPHWDRRRCQPLKAA